MKGSGRVCKHVSAVLLQVRGALALEAEQNARTYEKHLAISQTPLQTRIATKSLEIGTFAKGVAKAMSTRRSAAKTEVTVKVVKEAENKKEDQITSDLPGQKGSLSSGTELHAKSADATQENWEKFPRLRQDDEDVTWDIGENGDVFSVTMESFFGSYASTRRPKKNNFLVNPSGLGKVLSLCDAREAHSLAYRMLMKAAGFSAAKGKVVLTGCWYDLEELNEGLIKCQSSGHEPVVYICKKQTMGGPCKEQLTKLLALKAQGVRVRLVLGEPLGPTYMEAGRPNFGGRGIQHAKP